MTSGRQGFIHTVKQQFAAAGSPRGANVSSTSLVVEPHSVGLVTGAKTVKDVVQRDVLTPSIFHETWWLDSATGGDFRRIEVTAEGKTVGSLPVSYRRRFGYREVCMPCMTPFLGPAVDEGTGSKNNRFLRRLSITRDLINGLPKAATQYIKCHKGVEDVIAFQECGFRTRVQFTHEIKPEAEEQLWMNLRNKTRNVIRRAAERLEVREMTDPEEFIAVYRGHVQQRQLDNIVDFKRCQAAIGAALERGRGRILAAYLENKAVAANFCVWDNASSFYLLSTRTGDSGNGATSLLLWDAIKASARRGLCFDLAGLGTPGSVLMFSGFGVATSPRYVAVRANLPMRLISEVRAEFHPEHFFF